MFLWPRFLAFAPLLALAIACNSGSHSPAGFRLPADGNPERGKAVFLALECHQCHEVAGVVDMPRPTVQPPVPVVLGGEVNRPMGDGYLVTSIINPSFKLARVHPKEQVSTGGESRMPHYDNLTVRQLTDIVAFLQSQYRVRTPQPKYSYH